MMRTLTAAAGKSPFYDEVKDLALAPPVSGDSLLYDEVKDIALTPPAAATGPYGAPVTFEVTQQFSVPVASLPKSGTHQLRLPDECDHSLHRA